MLIRITEWQLYEVRVKFDNILLIRNFISFKLILKLIYCKIVYFIFILLNFYWYFKKKKVNLFCL